MGDLTPSSAGSVPGLAIEAVEWLPSGAESGLIRVRGRWAEGAAAQPELPALLLRLEGREHRFDSLPDARFGRDPASWRGSYLVPADLVARDPEALWIEWPGGLRAGLPPLARGLEPPPVDAPERPSVPEGGQAGGQVIDRAVLAERRARRAEAAEQAQARIAAEAVKAVEVLELRSSELERRLEEATAERDALAGRVGEGAETERERQALAAALESAARLRAQLGEWRLRLRTAEVAHATDAVRLAVLESRAAAADAGARAALHARTHELEEERRLSEERAAELAATRAEAAAAQQELARARAAATDELASARAAWERRRDELERALEDVRAALTRAREEADARVAEVEAAVREHQARGTELERRLAEEHEARTSAEATASELRGRLTAAEALASDAGTRLAAAETAATTAESRLRVESVARAALEDELDRERAARATLAADLDTAQTNLDAARAALEAERAARRAAEEALEPVRRELGEAVAARDAAAGELARARAELEAARAELAAARADLDGARNDLAAARREIESHARSLEEERAARAAAEAAADEGRRTGASLHDRIAELERASAAAPSPERLERLAREQAEAAAARPAQPPANDLAARLDAAAEALRLRDEGAAVDEGAAAPEDPVRPERPERPVVALAPERDEPPDQTTAVAHGERPERPALAAAAARAAAPDGLPVLRSAVVRLAQDDPDAARRLLAGLLPGQAAVVAGPLAYDLTIRDVGTYAITIEDGHGRAERVGRPRSRRASAFHLTADVLTLAELLSGVDHRIGRFFGPARFRGSRRRMAALEPLRGTPPTLAEVLRAGASIEPELAWRTLGYAVHPSWTRGLRFTVAQVLSGPEPRTWYLTARDGAGLAVTTAPPGGDLAATVTMSRSAFDRLLRDEPYEPGDRPAVRGDRQAVAALLGLADRAARRA